MPTSPQYAPPDDAETIYEKSDFQEAAKKLKGSRDLGAQLFCALLRSADVETRLVSSLQPLSFNGGGPPMPRALVKKARPATPEMSDEGEAVNIRGTNSPFGSSNAAAVPGLPVNPRRRLGHPNAADYFMPDMSAPTRLPPKPKPKVIH